MPYYVVKKLEKLLHEKKKRLKNASILIIGIAYKKNVKDLRGSPAIKIINILKRKKANISYYDPYFPYFKINGIDMKPVKINEKSLKSFDAAILIADHSNLNYKNFARNLKLILDTRNVFSRLGIKSKNIVKL